MPTQTNYCLHVRRASQEQIATVQSQQKKHAEIWLTVFECCLMKCYEIDFLVEKYVPQQLSGAY